MLSLKKTGILGGLIDKVSDVSKVADSAEDLARVLRTLDNVDDMAKVMNFADVTDDIALTALQMNGLGDQADDVVVAMHNIGESTKGVDGVKNAFRGLGRTLLSIAPAIGAVVAIGAGLAAFDYFTHAYTRAAEDAEVAASEYSQAKESLQSLNSEYDTNAEKIRELQALKANNSITMAQEVELASLEKQNTALERQISLQKSLVEVQAQASGNAAKKAATTETSWAEEAEAQSDGSFWGNVAAKVTGLFGSYQYDPKRQSASQMWEAQDTTVNGRTATHIQELLDYQEELQAVEKQLIDSPKNEQLLNGREDLKSKIETAQNRIASDQNELQGYIEQSTDENGAVIKGMESYVDSWNASLNKIGNVGKSAKEIDLNNLETFFNSSTGSPVGNKLKEIVEESGSAQEALKEFQSLGLSLDDIGVSESGFVRYFEDIKRSAEEAADAVNEIDGSLEGISAAFESANAGDGFVQMKDYLDKAQELYEQGLTGTDDFQAVNKMITQGTGKDYATAYADLQKYFTTDDSGNLTREGVQNFADEFNNLGKSFKTTGEYAREMELSTQMFETIMGRLSDYQGFEGITEQFEGMVKTTEQLGEARKNLEGLKEIRDGMEDGAEKTKLSADIEEWEALVSEAESTLDSLSEEKVTKLRFEYDRQTLEQANADAEARLEAGDGNTLSLNADIIVNNDDIIEGLAETNNIEIKANAETAEAQAKIDQLKESLRNETDEAKRIEIQADVQKAQQDLIDLLDVEDPNDIQVGADVTTAEEKIEEVKDQDIQGEVTVDADTSQAEEKIQEVEDKDIESNVTLTADDDDIAAIISEDGKTITMNVDANTEQIQTQIDSLEEGKTLTFTANVDGATTTVEAIKNEDGTITYTANVGDTEAELSRVENADGTVTYTADTSQAESEASGMNVEATATVSNVDSSKVQAVNVPVTPLPTTTQLALDALTAIVNYRKGQQDPPTDENANVNYLLGQQANPASPKSAIVNYTLGSVDTPPDVTRTVTYIGSFPTATGTANPSGAAFSKGTISKSLANGIAFASGVISGNIPKNALSNEKYQTKQNQMALTGELGRELLVNVKDNSWRILGDRGAEFNPIPAGSIIFNHKQTEELLNNGFTNSRGVAHGAGTITGGKAFADGTSDEEDVFEEVFDHVKIWIDRFEAEFDKLVDSIKTYSYDINKQNSMSDRAMTTIRNDLGTFQKAFDEYMRKADESGLEQEWRNVVNSGEIRVSTITDEDLKKRIDDYQEYYEKALDVQERMTELQQQLLDLAVEKLDNIDQYYSNRFDYNEDFGYSTSVNDLKKALQAYSDELAKQMSDGVIVEYSNEWYDAQKEIADYTQSILEASWAKFEDEIDYLSRVAENLEGALDVKEARGNLLSEADYQKQIANNNKLIQSNYSLRNSYVRQQAIYDVGSEKYRDLAKKIADCDDEIYNLLESNEELKNSIFEARFTRPFEALMDASNETQDSLENLRDLINEDSLFDKNGSLTANGLAFTSLLGQSLEEARKQVANYTTALDKLQKAYKSGLISQTEFQESQSDLLSGLQDSVGAVDDYKQEIIDLYTEQLQAEIEYQQDYYDKRKESLDLDKEYYEFSKKVASQNKSINQLKAQISVLMGDNSQAGRAQLKRLQAQLQEEEEALAETKKDHEYDMQERGYDELSDRLSESLDETLYEIALNSSKQEQVISDMLGRVVDNYKTAYNTINSIIADTGFQGNTGFNTSVNNTSSAIGAGDMVHDATQSQSSVKADSTISNINTGNVNVNPTNDAILSAIQTVPNTTNRPVAELTLSTTSVSVQEGSSTTVSASVRPTDAKNKTLKWTSSNTSVATVSGGTIKGVKAGSATIVVATTDGSGISKSVGVSVTAKPAPAPPAPAPTSGGDGVPTLGEKVRYVSGRYYYDSYGTRPSGYQHLGEEVYITHMNMRGSKPYHISTSPYLGGGDLGWLSLDQITGYASGTRFVDANGIYRTNEQGEEILIRPNGEIVTPLQRGSGVLSNPMTEKLYSLAENFDPIMNASTLGLKMMSQTPVVNNTVNNNPVNVNIDSLFTVQGNVEDATFLDKLNKELPKMADKLTDIVSRTIVNDVKKL